MDEDQETLNSVFLESVGTDSLIEGNQTAGSSDTAFKNLAFVKKLDEVKKDS